VSAPAAMVDESRTTFFATFFFAADFFIDLPAIVFNSKKAVAQTCRRQ
jgi:hypothetical protein